MKFAFGTGHMTRHFLTLMDLSPAELQQVITRAIELKHRRFDPEHEHLFKNRVLAMIFDKSSTRTRVSFESAMAQCGGSAIFLSPRDTQFGRGEPLEDSARVLSRMVDIVMIRTHAHTNIELFSRYSQVPVINALTDDHHPCQLLADMQTYQELRGSIAGCKVAWIGDGNNMCNSYIHAAEQFNFQLTIACPEGFEPKAELVEQFSHRVILTRSMQEAAQQADLVVTDVWASMGQEEEQAVRKQAFSAYQVTPEIMDYAQTNALFMHCLPAHRGEEVSHELLDDPRSVIWQEAENRLHSQKALIEFLLFG